MQRNRTVDAFASIGRALLWLLPLAAALNALLDVPAAHGVTAPDIGVLERSALFVLSTLLVAMVGLGLLGLIGRGWPTALVLITITFGIAFANHQKLRFRFEPLSAGDVTFVTQLPFLLSIVQTRDLVTFGTIVVLTAAVLILLRRVVAPPRPEGSRLGLPLPVRCVLVLASLAGLAYASSFNHQGNLLRRTYEAAGADWLGWQQGPNYERHGFVAGLLNSTTDTLMERPAGYSRAMMRTLAEKYSKRAAQLNQGGPTKTPNVVVVLSESFTDPLRLRAHRVQRDPIPFTRRVMAETTSGQLVTTHYGGGTANVEFEVLTGLSKVLFSPQVNTPFHQVLPELAAGLPSATDLFEQQGYSTLGIHPFDPDMYLRADAYRTMGFDEFLDQEDVPEIERPLGRFRSDSASYEAVIDAVERAGQPLFVSLVTIQNHVPYRGSYPDPIPAQGPGTEAELEEFSHYARGLERSDRALQSFLDKLKRTPEPTLVVLFGDHHPGVWSPSTRRTEPAGTLNRTPFFIWSTGDQRVVADTTDLSAQHLLPLAVEHAGLPVSPLYALLHDLRVHTPVLEPGLVLGPDGKQLNLSTLDPDAQRLFSDYRMVQYDLTIGAGFAAEEFSVAAQ